MGELTALPIGLLAKFMGLLQRGGREGKGKGRRRKGNGRVRMKGRGRGEGGGNHLLLSNLTTD